MLDVDDMKPYFVLHQYTQEIKENTPIGSQVAMVKAKDGDKGIDAEINYAIVAGKSRYDNIWVLKILGEMPF